MRQRTKRLAGLAGACAGLFGVLYLAAVETRWGHRAGNAALAGRHNRPPAIVADSLEILGTISVASLAVAGGTVCVVGLVRGGWRLGFGAGAVILGANVTTQVLKKAILTRPIFVDEGDSYGYANSLPSGHATVAMSLAVGIVLVCPARYRLAAAAGATAYAVAVGVATVVAGWHRPSDVMAAYLVTVGWGAAVAAVLLVLRERRTAAKVLDRTLARRTQAPLGWTVALGSGSLALALAALLGVVVDQAWDDLRTAEFDAAFFAGVACAACAGVASMAALLTWLAGIDLGAIDDGPR